jgi:hypothetical protein
MYLIHQYGPPGPGAGADEREPGRVVRERKGPPRELKAQMYELGELEVGEPVFLALSQSRLYSPR